MTAAPTFVCRLQLCPTDRAWAALASIARVEARRAGASGLDADDLFSIGAVALVESVARLDVARDRTFDAYVIESARGAMHDAIRAGARRASARAGEHGAMAVISEFAGRAAEGIRDARDVERIIALLETLPKDEAFVVRAHHLAGRPMDDVAREAGVTTPTAWRTHKRAIERLRATIGVCLESGEIQSGIRTRSSRSPSPRARCGSGKGRSSSRTSS